MKTKIISIIISVVVVAGGATVAGVAIKNHNDKETASLVAAAASEAASRALASTEEATTVPTTTTTTTTTEPTTDFKFEGGKKLPSTERETKKYTETTHYNDNASPPTAKSKEKERLRPQDAVGDKRSSPDGDYWETLKSTEENGTIYVDKNNHHFYFKNGDKSTKKIYID